jgi:hypothetical protein
VSRVRANFFFHERGNGCRTRDWPTEALTVLGDSLGSLARLPERVSIQRWRICASRRDEKLWWCVPRVDWVKMTKYLGVVDEFRVMIASNTRRNAGIAPP